MALQLKPGERIRYRTLFAPDENGHRLNDLAVEFAMFLRGGSKEAGTTKYDHCERIVKFLWPKIDYHEWLEEELREFCKTDFTGLTGSASSSKSFGMAVYCLVDWYADPINTLAFVISTNKVDARQRIWSYVQSLHNSVSVPMPGRLMHSTDAVALREMPKGQEGTDQSQIALVAGGEADAVTRLQGKKNARVRIYCDEGQDVNPALGQAMWNLLANPSFQMRVAGNASQTFDFHGKFCEPIAEMGGHGADLEDLKVWPILAMGMFPGTCLHFNNIWSPNFRRQELGLPLLAYLPRPEQVLAIRRTLGADDPVLWRQHIGIWAKTNGTRQTVLTDPETIKFNIRQREDLVSPKMGLGIDPSYTEFGDNFVVTPFAYGRTADGSAFLQLYKPIIVPDAPYPEGGTIYRGPFARVKRVRDIAAEYGVAARCIGMDTTGANPLGPMLTAEVGGEILGVEFGAGASDELAVSLDDSRVSKEAYMDKATELVFALRAFAEHNQLRGCDDPQVLRQLTNRKFSIQARGRVKIEPKKDYKKRTGGRSPDELDSACVCVEVARQRMGAIAGQAVIEVRQALYRRDAKKAAAVRPMGLAGMRGVGALKWR